MSVALLQTHSYVTVNPHNGEVIFHGSSQLARSVAGVLADFSDYVSHSYSEAGEVYARVQGNQNSRLPLVSVCFAYHFAKLEGGLNNFLRLSTEEHIHKMNALSRTKKTRDSESEEDSERISPSHAVEKISRDEFMEIFSIWLGKRFKTVFYYDKKKFSEISTHGVEASLLSTRKALQRLEFCDPAKTSLEPEEILQRKNLVQLRITRLEAIVDNHLELRTLSQQLRVEAQLVYDQLEGWYEHFSRNSGLFGQMDPFFREYQGGIRDLLKKLESISAKADQDLVEAKTITEEAILMAPPE